MEYGLIGAKLGHSHSPRIHRLLAGYDYQLKELSEEELPAFLEARDFKGLNVTIPYKQAVVPYCSALGEGAQRIGCVNTLVVRPDGSLFGDNTDYYGFCCTLRRAGIQVEGRKALVLGTGGTSLTASRALEDLGAREVLRVSRSGPIDYTNVYDHTDAQLIVNTTPVGMYPNNGARPVDLSRFPRLEGVADVIPNPAVTALGFQAKELGLPLADGMPMLVAQAKRACELFTNSSLPEGRLEEVLAQVRRDVTNLVLLGMPGCGKTRVGQLAAQALGREFYDSDQLIEAQAGKSIPEIFATEGEDAFRALECRVLAELGKKTGVVIATGGGWVKRPENLAHLRQNGFLCRLERPLAALSTDGRPLSASPEALARLLEEREPLYAAAAQATVPNTSTPQQAAGEVVEAFLHWEG